jgi:hypothetical protein
MKSSIYYSMAAAVSAAPIGWLIGGVIAANEQYKFVPNRPHYVSGNYLEEALIAAVFVFTIIFLIGCGRASSNVARVGKATRPNP